MSMFYRSIIEKLDAWATKPERKPLILRGARQVGKTTIVDQFGGRFDHYIKLNLEVSSNRQFFEQGYSAKQFIDALFFNKNLEQSQQRKTLLFIDEIQQSPEAVSLLRYFYEELPWLHVIGAGSLLENLIDVHISFPVGRVEYAFMYPMTFNEFLLASDEREAADMIESASVPEYAHTKMLSLFHEYTLLGGMPGITATYLANNKDLIATQPLYEGLLLGYQDDVEKYEHHRSRVRIIRHVITTAPLSAGGRIKFQGFGTSNYGSREIGEALRMLEKTMLLKLIYPTVNTTPPFEPNLKKSPKLHFLDTGLMNFACGLQGEFFGLEDLHNLYRGKVIEHIVGQELMAHYTSPLNPLSFWVREKKQSNAEINFVLSQGHKLFPIEVKAGKQGTLKSLQSFMDHVDHQHAVRLYAGNMLQSQMSSLQGRTFTLHSIPYYLASKVLQILKT